MSARSRLAAAVSLTLLIFYYAPAEAAAPVVANARVPLVVDGSAPFTDDDLLLFEVTSDGAELSDGISGYSSRAGLFLPFGELSRLLDLAIQVDPVTGRAEGWFLSEDRTFAMDLRAHRVTVAGKAFDISDNDAALFHEELYVRSNLFEKLFPITFKVNKSDLTIEIVAKEHFPFQDRLERERRRQSLKNGRTAVETVLKVPTSYELFTPPSADLSVSAAVATRAPKATANWEVRVAGDVVYSGAQLFVGSDSNGKPNDIRTLFERKDPDGISAGFFGATRSDAGDVYTPSLALGAASQGGRGLSMTSVPLDVASVFSTTDLRGELPQGYEVELYVNEVLRGSQGQPVRGNYEFLSVPLSYGLNVIRLVFYGPRGERREQVSRINVGSGQLHAGQFAYALGAMQQQVPLFDVKHSANASPGRFGLASFRLAGTAAFGVSDDFTLTAGLARFVPDTSFDHQARELGTAGILSSVFGLAVELDGAGDNHGAAGLAGGIAGRLFGVSLLARHSEYSGRFVDELQFRDLTNIVPLRRASDLTADWSVPMPFTDLLVPISIHAQRSQFIDGSERLLGEARLSTAIGRYLISGGWQFEEARKPLVTTKASQGSLDASAFVWRTWQVRAEMLFDGEPKLRLASASIVIDGSLWPDNMVRVGATHTFVESSGPLPPGCTRGGSAGGGSLGATLTGGCSPAVGTTPIDASSTWHFSNFDFTVDGMYTPELHDLRFGVTLAVGALFDSIAGEYVPIRPGAAAGGTALLNAFVDKNGNGMRDADEIGIAGVNVQAGNWPGTTDKNGKAIISGLGDSAHARIHVDSESISDPYLVLPSTTIEIVPHPGRVTVVDYPLTAMGEIAFKALFTPAGGAPRGLSALGVQALTSDGTLAAEGRTEYDGTLIFERLKPGTYSVRIDPDQAKRLKLKFTSSIEFTIPARGGYAGLITATVSIVP
jgi:hypothetical protein